MVVQVVQSKSCSLTVDFTCDFASFQQPLPQYFVRSKAVTLQNCVRVPDVTIHFSLLRRWRFRALDRVLRTTTAWCSLFRTAKRLPPYPVISVNTAKVEFMFQSISFFSNILDNSR